MRCLLNCCSWNCWNFTWWQDIISCAIQGLLRYDAVSLNSWFPTFRSNTVPSSSKVSPWRWRHCACSNGEELLASDTSTLSTVPQFSDTLLRQPRSSPAFTGTSYLSLTDRMALMHSDFRSCVKAPIIMRFVISVVFCEITNLECVSLSNTTIFIGRI